MLSFVALMLVLAVVATAIEIANDDDGGGKRLPQASGGGQPLERTSFLARIIPAEPQRAGRPEGPRIPRSIADLVARLPLERQVAQLMLVGFRGTDLTAAVYRQLRRLDYGGIVIDTLNYTDPQLLSQMAGEAVVISQQERHVPPWVMAAQEGGEFNVFADLPPALAPSGLANPEQAEADAEQAAATLRALGITGLLAPVIDVGLETDPALGPRAYSDDPEQVAEFARATVGAYRRGRVFSAVKHFPGLGTASQPTVEGPAQVGQSVDELKARDLVPFEVAFQAGAPAVVLSNALYAPDDFTRPGSLSKNIATGLLREQMGFRGVAITDDLADPAVSAFATVPDAALAALRAGADMLFISGPPGDQAAAYATLLQAARRSAPLRRRIQEALGRILIAKTRYGLIR
jgi:beta-N-acetylhexosaminidase